MKRLSIFNQMALAKALFLAVFALSTTTAFAEEHRTIVIGAAGNITADDSEEVVAIGGMIKVKGTSKGEVLAIGGEVDVNVSANGDIVAIGGQVSVAGVTTQDAVVIGGDVFVEITVADELFVAGGQVEIGPNTSVAGTSSFFGGAVSVDGVFAGPVESGGGAIELIGQFAGDVEVGGDDVTLEGYFNGDVTVSAVDISFGENVQFLGDLTVKSPQEVTLPEGIEVAGDFTYEYISKNDIEIAGAEFGEVMAIFGVAVAAVAILFLAVFLIGIVVVTASGSISTRGVAIARAEPWKTVGVGTGVLILMPIAFGILTAINDAFAPLFIIYALVGCVGFAMAGYVMITLMIDGGRKTHSGGKRFGYALLGTFLLTIVCIIPLLGTLAWCAAIIFGTGAYASGLLSKDKPEAEPEPDQERTPATEVEEDED